MDVRCNRCGTEYELDDARVAQSGTTVKCSSCGHVFKVLQSGQTQSVAPAPAAGWPKEASAPVRRPSTETPTLGSFPSPPSSSSSSSGPVPAGEWMVKKTDGQTFRFRELTTLQKWIVERKVGRDDEISRSGKSWKRLGEIAELTSFFQVVEAAEAAQRAPGFQGQAPTPQMPNIQLSATPTGTFSAVALPMPGVTVDSSGQPLTQPPITLAPTTRPPAPVAAEPAPRPKPKSVVEEPSNELDELDDDDPVLAWQRKRKNFMAAVVAASVVVIVIVIIAVLGSGPSGLDPTVQSTAMEALKSDDDQRREGALILLAPHAAHPTAQAWRARLLAARAQALLDENRLKELLGKLDLSAAALVPSTKDGEQLLAEATAAIVALRAKDPVPPEVDLAAAAIALAKGDPQQLTTDVALAQEHGKVHGEGPERAAIDTEARLLLTLAEAHKADDVGDARESLQKLERFNDGRARSAAAIVGVTLAALSRTKEAAAPKDVVDAAAALVGRLSDRDARKEIAQKILSAAATPVTPPGDPVPAPPVDPTTPTTPTTPTPTPTTPPVTPVTPVVPVAGDAYEVVMQKAEKALVSERSQAAYDLLKKAVTMRPDVARPWLKLGWAAMDTGRHGEAQRAFKRALDVDSSLSEAQFGLAEALSFGGKKPEALAAYKAYLAMDPSGKEANIAKRAIEQLE
ncbi:MAG: zinc-ribbon domain-containing protein [Deltaproteobacteria bacterium]|nr:zinc-ribbon domain-containing protein [Deltaproteobacteria bacterium]